MVGSCITRAVGIESRGFDGRHQAGRTVNILLQKCSRGAAILGDQLATKTIDKTHVLTNQLAHPLTVAIVHISSSSIDFADLVFTIIGIGVEPVVQKIAGVVVARTGDAIVRRSEIQTLIPTTKVYPTIAKRS